MRINKNKKEDCVVQLMAEIMAAVFFSIHFVFKAYSLACFFFSVMFSYFNFTIFVFSFNDFFNVFHSWFFFLLFFLVYHLSYIMTYIISLLSSLSYLYFFKSVIFLFSFLYFSHYLPLSQFPFFPLSYIRQFLILHSVSKSILFGLISWQ